MIDTGTNALPELPFDCDGEARAAGTGFHLFSPLFVILGHC